MVLWCCCCIHRLVIATTSTFPGDNPIKEHCLEKDYISLKFLIRYLELNKNSIVMIKIEIVQFTTNLVFFILNVSYRIAFRIQLYFRIFLTMNEETII